MHNVISSFLETFQNCVNTIHFEGENREGEEVHVWSDHYYFNQFRVHYNEVQTHFSEKLL